MDWAMRRILIVISIFVVVVSSAFLVGPVLQRHMALWAVLSEVREISYSAIPSITGATGKLRIALILRDAMHRLIPNRNDASYNFMAISDTYRKSLLDPDYGHICGGRVVQYLVALRAFGIPARKVSLFPTVAPFDGNSHASVSVMIDGKWIAMDPQFNISLKDKSGKHIGWIEARETIRNGQAVHASTDGFPVIHVSFERYAEASKLTLKDWTRYINTSISTEGEAFTFPSKWDGVLHYPGGRVFNSLAGDSGDIYRLLVKGR